MRCGLVCFLPVARHLDRARDRLQQAAAIGLPGSGQIECRTVIHRGADNRQAKRNVDALTESGIFQDRQTLVVKHRQHTICVFQIARLEQRIGRLGAARFDTFRSRLFERRADDIDFLASEITIFARMRIESGYQYARRIHTEGMA